MIKYIITLNYVRVLKTLVNGLKLVVVNKWNEIFSSLNNA